MVDALTDPKKKQLLECIHQLGDRAIELDELHVACCLNTVCGAIMSGDDDQLALLCETFSHIKLNTMKKEEATIDKLFKDLKNGQD